MFSPHTIKGKKNLRLDLIANPPIPEGLPLVGLQLDLNADNGFVDSSPESRTVVNNNAITIISNDVNGHDSYDIIRASQQSMQIANDTEFNFNTTGFTLFSVANFTVATGWHGLYGHNDGAMDNDKLLWGTTAVLSKTDFHVNSAAGDIDTVSSIPTISTSGYEIRALRVAADMDFHIYEQATLNTSGTMSASSIPSPSASVYIGWGGEQSSYLDAKLARFLVYNRDLSDSEMTDVFDVLKLQYNL